MTRRRVEVRGVVQGVGFRPFVAGLAADLGLTGSVLNHARGVTIDVEGPQERIVEFIDRLRSEPPPLARVLAVSIDDLPPGGERDFRIAGSTDRPGARTLVPPDAATCADCLRELFDPADRRHRHPFITCTNCGPRLSIITGLPYDRDATTMVDFPLCDTCATEYADPSDRRHHAQPIACHDCGPTLTLRDPSGLPLHNGEAALAAAQDALAAGSIVAIKGLGGYHLACDAANAGAVQRLRDRKHRPDKPFAVMVPDLGTAADLLRLPDEGAQTSVLVGPEAPILLAPARGAGGAVAPQVAPGLDELGVMVAYTPVHHLLFAVQPQTGRRAPRVLVMTSGNLTDEPLAFDDDDALARLAPLADLFLTHDRRIHVPVEDSVVTIEEGAVVPIRRSRGHAPLPVALPPVPDASAPAPVVLAVGAEIKNTFCLTREDWAFCSAHIGDMGTLESQRAFGRSVDQLLDLHDARPTAIAADQHPAYATRGWAERRASADDVPLHLVQHHHAHLAALLTEKGRLAERVLGLAFDGTGHGCDTTAWGGEFLLSPGDVTAIERLGHLAPFSLPGGDVAVRRPIRIGLALLHEAGMLDRAADLWPDADPTEMALVTTQLARGGQPRTTSVGRLWDGLAAILGVRVAVTYEAQAAVELEVLARRSPTSYAVRLPVRGGRLLDVVTFVRGVVEALDSGADRAAVARGIHDALIAGASALAIDLADRSDVSTVGLTGGVFSNRLLTAGLRQSLTEAGLTVLTHHLVPANDGGLALGQAVIARSLRLSQREGDRPCV